MLGQTGNVFSLTHPAIAVAGAAAMVVPIAIHLLTLMRRRPEPWAAMRFVIEAYQRHRRRLRFEQWLLLLAGEGRGLAGGDDEPPAGGEGRA